MDIVEGACLKFWPAPQRNEGGGSAGIAFLKPKIAKNYVKICARKSLKKIGWDKADMLEGASLKLWPDL